MRDQFSPMSRVTHRASNTSLIRRLLGVGCLLMLLANIGQVQKALGEENRQSAGSGLRVVAEPNTQRLTAYQIFELTFRHAGHYHNPTWDIFIEVILRSPTGKQYRVGGFYYGPAEEERDDHTQEGAKSSHASSHNESRGPLHLWKARYAPSEFGEWSY